MNPEEQVRSALRALAEHDGALKSSTPASAIFVQRSMARRGSQSRWMWLGAIAAAAAAAFAMWSYQPMPHQKLRMEVNGSQQDVTPEPAVVASTAPAPPAPKPVRRVKHVAKRTHEAPQEIATEFFPLMDSPPPFERGQLVRVVVPAETMRTVGLPVAPERWNDRVQADVLVGEEGMPRAIRFVSFRQ